MRRHPLDVRLLAGCLCLLLAAGGGAPGSADAHGGKRIVTRLVGGYRIALDALAVRNGQTVAVVDYTVYLRARRSGGPIDNARVVVTVHTPEGVRGPFVAHRRTNTYETLIPVAKPNEWPRYHLDVRIASPVGQVAIVYTPPRPAFVWLWRQPEALGVALVALLLYLRAYLRLRRRGRRDHASIGRLVLFCSGIAAAVLAVVSPVDPIGETYLLSVHMLQHVLIGDVAPALILAGLRGPLSLLVVPATLLRLLAGNKLVRRVGHVLLRPTSSLAIWAVIFAGWHIPAAYDFALAHRTAHDLEHETFFLAGMLVWIQLVDPFPRQRLTIRTRLAVALGLFALGTILADTLLLSPRPLYPTYVSQPDRLWGLSPIADQRLAGAVMMLEQIATITICIAFLARAHRRAQARRRAHSNAGIGPDVLHAGPGQAGAPAPTRTSQLARDPKPHTKPARRRTR